LRVEEAGGAISDDWKESLALSILCGVLFNRVYVEEDLNHGCLVLQLLSCPVLLDLGIFGPLVGAQDHQQPIQRFM
jgi:hypothetical protein